jgi:hypothetical protein
MTENVSLLVSISYHEWMQHIIVLYKQYGEQRRMTAV